MTASYDGNLRVRKNCIEACCRALDRLVISGEVYVNTKGEMSLRIQERPRKGVTMIYCPFCGAEVSQ